MRKENALIKLFRDLVDLLGQESARNPEFAERLQALLVPITERPNGVRTNRRVSTTSLLEMPDIYAEFRAKGEEEFRLWLRDKPLEVLRTLIKQHDLDPTRRTYKWKEREKLSAYIADQLQARLSRGSRFMRG
jgi:hypothetical protein